MCEGHKDCAQENADELARELERRYQAAKRAEPILERIRLKRVYENSVKTLTGTVQGTLSVQVKKYPGPEIPKKY
jgi:hypothetical protein